MQSYQTASARIVLDAQAVLGGGIGWTEGKVVLNVTDNEARSLTVQDRRTGKALGRVKGADNIRKALLPGASARDRATVAGFTR